MDPIVVKTLEYLTPNEGRGSGVNTDLLHENDRDEITAFFTVLKELKVLYNPDEIEEWLINSKWWPNERVTIQVIEIVRDINNGIRKRIRKREVWLERVEGRITNWKKELEEDK